MKVTRNQVIAALDFDPHQGIKKPQMKRGRARINQPMQPTRTPGTWMKPGGKAKRNLV